MSTCSALQLFLFELPVVSLESEGFMFRNRDVSNQVFVGEDLAAESVCLLWSEDGRLDVEIWRLVVMRVGSRVEGRRRVVDSFWVRWRVTVALKR